MRANKIQAAGQPLEISDKNLLLDLILLEAAIHRKQEMAPKKVRQNQKTELKIKLKVFRGRGLD